MTERRPRELAVTKKCCLLRLTNIRLPLYSLLWFSARRFAGEKSPKNHSFLAHLEKKVYLCAQISKRIDMRSNEISYFISFCIEQYKQKHQLTGEQAMLELDKYGVLEYLEEFYEVLHTQSAQWIVEDIDNYINQRKP